MVASQPKLFFLASKGTEIVVEFIALRKLFELLKQTAYVFHTLSYYVADVHIYDNRNAC
jgi:hypothetical protein